MNKTPRCVDFEVDYTNDILHNAVRVTLFNQNDFDLVNSFIDKSLSYPNAVEPILRSKRIKHTVEYVKVTDTRINDLYPHVRKALDITNDSTYNKKGM